MVVAYLLIFYSSLFTETRDSADAAVTASTAFKDIVQGINAAREASLQAVEAAELAKKAASGENLPQESDEQKTLLEMSEMSKERSLQLVDSGIQHSHRVKGTTNGYKFYLFCYLCMSPFLNKNNNSC